MEKWSKYQNWNGQWARVDQCEDEEEKKDWMIQSFVGSKVLSDPKFCPIQSFVGSPSDFRHRLLHYICRLSGSNGSLAPYLLFLNSVASSKMATWPCFQPNIKEEKWEKARQVRCIQNPNKTSRKPNLFWTTCAPLLRVISNLPTALVLNCVVSSKVPSTYRYQVFSA